MNAEYKPSPDFVSKVMEQVHVYEASQTSFAEWLLSHFSIRFALAGGGTLFGILKAVPVF